MKTVRPLLPRIPIFVVGLVVSLTALLAPSFGLGAKGDFILYRWWHLSRSSTLQIGLILVLLSFLPKLENLLDFGKALHRELRTSIAGERPNRTAPAPRSHFFLRLSQQFAFAILLASLALWLNRRNLLGYIDGQVLLTLVKNQSDFAGWNFGFSANPLQGLGDPWYFSNTRLIPELWVARLSSESDWQKLAVFGTAFAEIFLIVSWFSYWLGFSQQRAIVSGWLAAFLTGPLTYPPLIFYAAEGPQIAFLSTLPLIIVGLLEGIGRGAHWSDFFRTAAVCFLLWLHFAAFGLFVALTYPFLSIVWFVFVTASWPNRNEFWRKLAWSGFLLGVVILSGLPEILLGFIKNSAFYSFRDLNPQTHDLNEGSILFRKTEPIALIVGWLGLLGAIYHAIFSRGRLQRFASATAIVGGLIVVASLLHALTGLFGAKPIYYEYLLWPVYPIFVASIMSAGWKAGTLQTTDIFGFAGTQLRRSLWFFLPLFGLIVLHGSNYLRQIETDRPNIYPPTPTTLTEYLREEIGLNPGAPFKGRVVTWTGSRLPPKTSWDQMFTLDMDLIRSTGNDHRTIGLWYNNVPTLIEFNHALSAIFYSVVREYLIENGDIQVRNILNMRGGNVQILRLLGVRYVLTDRPDPIAGTHRVRELRSQEHDGISLAVDEIPNVNLGISPTKTIPHLSNEQALAWLENGDFSRVALLTDPNQGVLSAARNILINVEHSGIRVRATSSGRSLVIIPFAFSHCLRIKSDDNGQQPILLRADHVLTGLIFNESVDVTIQYRQGPFAGIRCRLNDFNDFLHGPAAR